MPTRERRSGRRQRPARFRTANRPSRPQRTETIKTYDQELDAALDKAAAEPLAESKDFADFDLPHRLVRGLVRGDIERPFAIQARTLPDSLAGRDILGRAQTGSGKTLAFGIPLIARLAEDPAGSEPYRPRGLVLVPTRELARQVTTVLAPLARRVKMKVTSVYGGAPIGRQIQALRETVDIVVATPGRLLDLNQQGKCDLGDVVITVLDEADHMADLGFLPDVTRILDLTPAGGQRLLFSATLDRGVSELVRRYLNDPAFHAVAPAAAPVSAAQHRAFVMRPEHKVAVAAEIAGRPGRTLFFVRTKHGADRLAKQLGRSGVHAAAIHGDMRQGGRQRALAGFAAGSPRVLVATDVAARGLHIDDVDLVVHYDPTGDPKDYLHRSGRTARAGASGTVLSLALPDERRKISQLHKQASVSAEFVDVGPGHDAVTDVAMSGEPVVVRPDSASSESSGSSDSNDGRSGNGNGRRRPSRPRRRPDGRGRSRARTARR